MWRTGDSLGPLNPKQTHLFLRSVIGYLHHAKQVIVEVQDTDSDTDFQVILLPTGKAVRESQEKKLQE